MKNNLQIKVFILLIAFFLIIPLVFALQAGFLEVKTLCLNGDCRNGFTIDTTLDTNSTASLNFRSTNLSWPGTQTFESFVTFEETVSISGNTQMNYRSSGSNISSPGINDLDIVANDQLMLKSSGVDIVEIRSEGVIVHRGDFNVFQGQTNISDANITILTVADTQGVDANYSGQVEIDGNTVVARDIILQTGQRICWDVDSIIGNGNDCTRFITHDGTGFIEQS